MRVPEYLMFTMKLTENDLRHRTRMNVAAPIQVQVEFMDHIGSIPRRYIDPNLLKLMIEAVDRNELLFMSFDEWAMRLVNIRYPAAEGRALIRVRKVTQSDCLPVNGWRPTGIRPGGHAEQELKAICDDQVNTIHQEVLTQMRTAAWDFGLRRSGTKFS